MLFAVLQYNGWNLLNDTLQAVNVLVDNAKNHLLEINKCF